MAKGRTGRPRGFDEEAALDAAMQMFWEEGYEGATLADLTRAMGINRSSMYAAFGDKEALFKLVIARYAQGPMQYIRTALAQPTLRSVVEGLLYGMVEFLSAPGNPRGCLSLQGALACGSDGKPAQQAMIEWRKRGEAALRKRFLRAQKDGDLGANINAADFARYIAALMSGVGIQAANGATKAEMKQLVDIALRLMAGSQLWSSEI